MENLLHDVNYLLYPYKELGKECQEEIIKGNCSEEQIVELEEIMRKYNLWYDCDFAELQQRVSKDLDKENFQPKS